MINIDITEEMDAETAFKIYRNAFVQLGIMFAEMAEAEHHASPHQPSLEAVQIAMFSAAKEMYWAYTAMEAEEDIENVTVH